MKRVLIFIACVMIGAAILVACGVLGASLFRKTNLVYTDGHTIRVPTTLATVREIMWEPPQALTRSINSDVAESSVHISADGLTLLFTRGEAGSNADIFIATRDRIDQPWGDPAAIPAITSLYDELGPDLSRDGQTMYFASNRPGGLGGYDIWATQREGNLWREPQNLGPSVNTPFDEVDPALDSDQSRLYFSSNRPAGNSELDETPSLVRDSQGHTASDKLELRSTDFDLYAAIIDGRSDAVAPVTALNSPADERGATFTPAGDFLYFCSNRNGGFGGFDLYRARIVRGEITEPANVGREINSGSHELDPCLAMEGFELHFSSDRLRGVDQHAQRELNVYRALSREVFTEVASTEPWIDLASLLNTLMPSLLWLILALLLLLALLAMLRGVKSRQLSLLARCLLASLMAHLIILMMLTFWQVTTSLAHAFDRGGVKVALVTSQSSDDLSEQVRGGLTEIQIHPIAEQPQRSETTMDVEVLMALARLETSAAAAPLHAAVEVQADPIDAAAPSVPAESMPIRAAPVEVVVAQLQAPASMPTAPPMEESSQVARPTPPVSAQPILTSAPQIQAEPKSIDIAPSRSAAAAAPPAQLVASLPQDSHIDSAVKEQAAHAMAVAVDRNVNETVSIQVPAPEASPLQSEASPETPVHVAFAAPNHSRRESPVAPQASAAGETSVQVPPAAGVVSVQQVSSPDNAAVDAEITTAMAAMETSRVDTAFTSTPPLASNIDVSPPVVTPDAAAVNTQDAGQLASLTPETLDTPSRSQPFAPAPAAATVNQTITPAQQTQVEVATKPTSTPGTELRDADIAMAPLKEDRLPEKRDVFTATSLAALDISVAVPPASGDAAASATPEPSNDAPLVPAVAAAAISKAAPNALSAPLPRMATLAPQAPTQVAPAPSHHKHDASPSSNSSDARMPPLPLVAMTDTSTSRSSTLAPVRLDGLSMPFDDNLPPDPFLQRQPEHRMKLVERMGGNEATERAVALALKWLAAHQHADGRWAAKNFDEQCGQCRGEGKFDNDIATTALTIMCFLASDHTHKKDGPYREQVERGLNWLVSQQKKGGDLRGDETMYSHAIAAIAISEAFGMTRDEKLFYPTKQATDFIIAAQNKRTGGWRYDPGQSGDTSVLGWQIMALVSAKRAGVVVPASVFEGAGKWLNSVSTSDRRGLYAYQPGKSYTPSMTAEAMFVQQLLGVIPAHPRMQESAKFIQQNPPRWKNDAATYYWYYATLAMFQHQGQEWEDWNSAITDELVANQRTDGGAAGSWDPVDNWSKIGGRVYQTALCTLCLEVYYRYLPMFADVKKAGE